MVRNSIYYFSNVMLWVFSMVYIQVVQWLLLWMAQSSRIILTGKSVDDSKISLYFPKLCSHLLS